MFKNLLGLTASCFVLLATACSSPHVSTDPCADAYCPPFLLDAGAEGEREPCRASLQCTPGTCEPHAPLSADDTEHALETWIEAECGAFWVRQYVSNGTETQTLVWDPESKELVGRRTRQPRNSYQCGNSKSNVLIEGQVPADCQLFGVPLQADAGATDASR